MAHRSVERDDVVYQGSSFQDVTKSLLRMAGGWGNTSGPGIFMSRLVFTGALNAITFGAVGGSFGGIIWGTATLPFLVTSCAGFIIGAVGFYKDAQRKALLNLERYPRLIQLHLDANFPSRGWDRYRRQDLTPAYFNTSWTLKSMLVCAWLTSQPALDEIHEARERRIVDELSQLDFAKPSLEGKETEQFET